MKGKGERGGSSGSNSKFFDESCPLQFPNLKPVDHTKTCPRYTSIIGRDPDVNDGMDCLGLEEVDALQKELETLSASVAKRMLLLQGELQILNASVGLPPTPSSSSSSSHDKGKGDKLSSSSTSVAASSSSSSHSHSATSAADAMVSSGGKRGSGKGKTSYIPNSSSDDKPPAKRMRTDSGRATYAQPMASSGSGSTMGSKGKGKFQQTKMSSMVDSGGGDITADRPASDGTAAVSLGARQPRNMTPSRFWAMVEPYCAPITPDDIKYLEEQLRICEDIGEYMKVPALGRHYAEKWAEEDLEQEQKEGSKLNERRKSSVTSNGVNNGSSAGSDAVSILKKAEVSDDDGSSPFGPLTQRLIQGLLEENIISSLDDNNMIISDADALTAATISPRSLAKQLHLGNPTVLERRIRRELEDIGVLGCEDSDDENSGERRGERGGDNGRSSEDGAEGEDEILSELRKKQAELKALSQQNTSVLRLLLKQAKEEMGRQELRNKMAAADNEVMEAYRRVQAAKAKKKTPSKKEKEIFMKALKDRETIYKQLLKANSSTTP